VNKVKKWNYSQNLHSKTEWYRYYGEYSLAIKTLLENSEESQSTVLALPVLFLIRHSLELAFKMNLNELEKVSGKKANLKFHGKDSHILHKLHHEFQKQVVLIFKKEKAPNSLCKEFNKRNIQLKAFRQIFDKLDEWSFAFRYPVTTDGKTKSFKLGDQINIADIIPVYEETQTILKYTTDVIEELINSK
jgi:hypothetical protein